MFPGNSAGCLVTKVPGIKCASPRFLPPFQQSSTRKQNVALHTAKNVLQKHWGEQYVTKCTEMYMNPNMLVLLH